MGVRRNYMKCGLFVKTTVILGVLLVLGIFGFASAPAYAQVTGATVSGTVTDASGGVVAGATVSFKDAATSTTREVTTDTAGLYAVPNLAPGSYEVRVTAKGFSTAVQSSIALAVGQQLQLNFSLKVGETSTTVEV